MVSFRLLFLLGMILMAASAQDRWGSLAGTVQDASGALAAGASVRAVNHETGLKRQTETDGSGLFVFRQLTPGRYTVTAEKSGFKQSIRSDAAVHVDRETRVSLVLEVGDLSESVLVTAAAGAVEASPSTLSTVVVQRAIEELPLNGRDVTRLITLASWAPESRPQVRFQNNGYGLQISVAGARPSQGGFRLDGIAAPSLGGSFPASINGLMLGVDTIQEFSLLASGFSAQYGRASGGIVNAVTRSGGNDLHGSLFYHHRNDNLDARNFFDPGSKPEFRRHQFGGSLGGPLRRDKDFFFVSYEALRELRGVTTTNTTLSEEARVGRLVSGQVTVDPVMAKVLSLYPRPNGPVLGDTALFIFRNDERGAQDFFTIRTDHAAGPQKFFVRYGFDDGRRVGRTDFDLGRTRNSTRVQSLVAEYSRFSADRLVGVSRFGFARSRTAFGETEIEQPITRDPQLKFVPGAEAMGVIDVTGLTLFPGGSNSLEYGTYILNSFQVSQDFTWIKGAHTLIFGGRLERTHFNSLNPNRINGEYRFSGIRQFLTNTPNRLRAMLPGSDPVRGFRQWLGAGYMQGSWRLRPRVTLQLGVRHEWATVPSEVNGKQSNLDRLSDLELRTEGPLFRNPSWWNVHPRAGLAWDVTGRGGTVLRAGYGIYPELLLSQYLLLAGLRNPPFFLRGSSSALQSGDFPSRGYQVFLQNPNAELRVERLAPQPSQPYIQQWNASMEQRIPLFSVLRISYTGSHGLNLSSITNDANLASPTTLPDGRLYFPSGGQRLNPRFSQIRDRTFNAQSFYHALHGQWNWQPSSGIQTQLSYTFSKSIDDSSSYLATSEAANAVMLPLNGSPRFNRGLSSFDTRHSLVFSGIWALPGPRGGWLGQVLGNWQAGYIATWSSGQPFTVRLAYDAARTQTSTPDRQSGQRPDLAPGARIVITGKPEQWVETGAFRRPQDGFLGDLGRNTVPGPGLANVDFSLSKIMRPLQSGERYRIEFRAEFFNLFNHTNFDLPAAERTEIFTRTSVREDFARITSAAPAREIQLGLKLRF